MRDFPRQIQNEGERRRETRTGHNAGRRHGSYGVRINVGLRSHSGRSHLRLLIRMPRYLLYRRDKRLGKRLFVKWLERGQPEAFPVLHTAAIPEDFVRRIADFQQALDRGR